MADIAAAGGREPPQVDGKQQDEEQTQPKLRDRQANEAEHNGYAVGNAARLECRHNAQRDRQYDRERHGGADEVKRDRQLFEHDLRDRTMLPEALAQIQMCDIRQEIDELNVERTIQSELLGKGCALRSG